MQTMRLWALSLMLPGLTACDPDPADCYDKGDEKACNALCETGKPELQTACYEMRARQVQACVEKDTDCPKACELWKNAEIVEDAHTAYVARLGSDAKVEALKAKCEAAK